MSLGQKYIMLIDLCGFKGGEIVEDVGSIGGHYRHIVSVANGAFFTDDMVMKYLSPIAGRVKDTLLSEGSEETWSGYIWDTPSGCLHEYVDMGFMRPKWVCKKCNHEKPEDS